MAERNLQEIPFYSIAQFGIRGLNDEISPEFINDTELAEAINVVFDNGIITSRPGSSLFYEGIFNSIRDIYVAKDTAEKEWLLSIGKDSGGNGIVAVYDEINNRFVKISDVLVIDTSKQFSFVTWNKGLGNDRVYFSQGLKTYRWYIGASWITTNLNGTETSIPLKDARRFPTPSSGSYTIIISDANTGNLFVRHYTSQTGNNLNLQTGETAPTVPQNSFVAIIVDDVTSIIEPGQAIEIWQNRLIVGRKADETPNQLAYSDLKEPEAFGSAVEPAKGGFTLIADGAGKIVGLVNLMQYLLVFKRDNLVRFDLQPSQDYTKKIEIVYPFIWSEGIGSVTHKSIVKAHNNVYYIANDGNIYVLVGVQSGASTSFNIQPKSAGRLSLDDYDFSECVGVYFDNKVFWSFKRKGERFNNVILLYDLIMDAFSLWEGLAINSFAIYQRQLLGASSVDGKILKIYDTSEKDDIGFSYEVLIKSKRFTFGEMAFPKVCDKIMITGYILPPTIIKVKILYEEEGKLGYITKEIRYNGDYVFYGIPNLWGVSEFGILPLIWSGENLEQVGFFRVYLDVPLKFGWNNIQFQFISQEVGQKFSIISLAINPEVVSAIPQHLVI